MTESTSRVELLAQFDKNEQVYKEFLEYFYSTIIGILRGESIDVQSVDTRLKKKDSLDKKIKLKQKYKMLEDITDICGMRIITYFSDDVDKIAKIIRNEFEIDEVNSVDKRTTEDPTKFGYVSLHYIVSLKGARETLPEAKRFKNMKIEIQIRTILQHAWAEIEHDLGYKTVGDIPKNIRRKFSLLAGQIELADEVFVTIKESMEEYSKEIKSQLNNDTNSLLIDIVTMNAFIKEDKTYVEKLKMLTSESYIAIEYSSSNSSKKYLSSLIEKCNALGIYTISELKEIFENYQDYIDTAYNKQGISGVSDNAPLGDIINTLYKEQDKNISKQDFPKKLSKMLADEFEEFLSMKE